MSQTRQLAAIMFTDIVGYTSMMQADEQKAVAVIKHYNSTLEKWVAHFGGQVFFTIFSPFDDLQIFC